MTSLKEERAEQQRWTARLRRPDPAYDMLAANEFDSTAARDATNGEGAGGDAAIRSAQRALL